MGRFFVAIGVKVLNSKPDAGVVDVGNDLPELDPGLKFDRCSALLARGIVAWFDQAKHGSAL